MTSLRRSDKIVEGNENLDVGNLTAKQLLNLLDDVGTIVTNGYTIRTITIKGRLEELADLADELQTWTPAGGWSKDARELLGALRGEYEED